MIPTVPPSIEQLWTHWRRFRLRALQGGAFLRALTRETLRRPAGPQTRGTLRAAGLDAPLEILRDAAGVPHCFAQSGNDALFALGFVHAQDRLWQMEFYRRVGAGRLAAVAGPAALPADRLMRHIGLQRASTAAWAATPPDVRAPVEAYIRGVNAVMVDGLTDGALPLEFRILNYRPEPWRPEDAILWAKLLAFMLSPAWEVQIQRARLVEAVGLEAVLAVDPGYPAHGPIIDPPGAPYGALGADLMDVYGGVARVIGLGGESVAGSNNWAVDAARAAGGHAILAADPHLSAVQPCFAYFAHLECPEWEVAGATLPGFPGVIWGFNRRIAWGPTAGLASTQDCFVEEFAPTGDRYRTPSGWAQTEVVEERIEVRGFPAETQRVRITRHGPVISPEIPGVRQALALRSAVLEPHHSAVGMLALLRAEDPETFRAALAEFHEFNLTVAYADVDGRVGMQVVGDVPRRRRGGGWLPAPGWDSSFDWAGYLAPSDLPHAFDPPGGRVWSANNAPQTAVDLPYAGEFLDAYRAHRIEQALAQAGPLTVDAAGRMQSDRHSPPMLALRSRLLAIEPESDSERALLERIRDWDGSLDPASVPAALVSATFSRLLDNVLRAKLGDATPIYLDDVHAIPNLNLLIARAASFIVGLLEERPAAWFGPVAATVPADAVWLAVLTRAFREARGLLRDRLGSDPERWTWGRCHRLTFVHGLGEVPALARLFNLGPFPLGGDANTLCQAGPISTDPFAETTTIPVARLIVELADPPRATFALAGGQSGRRGDPHQYDLLDDWRAGRIRPLLTDRDAIEAAGVERLSLVPDREP